MWLLPVALAHVQAGDPVPAFRGRTHDGLTLTDESIRGRGHVMWFYPKARLASCCFAVVLSSCSNKFGRLGRRGERARARTSRVSPATTRSSGTRSSGARRMRRNSTKNSPPSTTSHFPSSATPRARLSALSGPARRTLARRPSATPSSLAAKARSCTTTTPSTPTSARPPCWPKSQACKAAYGATYRPTSTGPTRSRPLLFSHDGSRSRLIDAAA